MLDKEKIVNALVNDIKNHFGSKLRKRPVSKTYETEIEYGLGQNNEKKYIGRFFNVTGADWAIWAGYDPNPDYDFNVSFSFKKGSDNEQILKNVLQVYDPKIGDRELDDNEGDFWFVINLNVIINNTGNIQIGGKNNTQENISKSSNESQSKIAGIISNAISIISSVLKAFGL